MFCWPAAFRVDRSMSAAMPGTVREVSVLDLSCQRPLPLAQALDLCCSSQSSQLTQLTRLLWTAHRLQEPVCSGGVNKHKV